MTKFFKVYSNNNKELIVLNIDDISFIVGNQVRMKSLSATKSSKWVPSGKGTDTLVENTYLDAEVFELTDESIKALVSFLTLI